MTFTCEKTADKTAIMVQLGCLSKLLGMIPEDAAVTVTDPVTQQSMALSEWLDDARKAFLKLSILLDKTLDLNLP